MKKLRKSNNKVISGVCAGIAEYFNLDPTIVRIAFVLFGFAGGSSFWLYIICACVMPPALSVKSPYSAEAAPRDTYTDIRDQDDRQN